VSGIIF